MQNYGYTGYPHSNNYGYPSYAPRYMPQAPQIPQSQPTMQPQMQMQPQVPTEMPIQDIRFVNKAQAEAFIVYPNTRVMLIDKDSGMVYVKSADNMGQLTQNDYFRYEKTNADGTPIKPQEPIPQVNFDEFVKVEQLKDMGFVTIDEHKKVLAELEVIKKALINKSQIAKGGTQ